MITSGDGFGEMLADSVFRFANEGTTKNVETARQWGVEPSRFIREKVYLHMWCVELGVTRAVGPQSSHRAPILGAFYRQAGAIATQMEWTSLLPDAAVRAGSYSEAFNRPHSMGIPYTTLFRSNRIR